MRHLALLLSALFIFMAGCSKNIKDNTSVNKEQFCGTWECDRTSARYKITCLEKGLNLEAWDTIDGEKFEVSDITFESDTLSATFKMPSSNHTTYSVFSVIQEGVMKERCTGDWKGTLTWKKIKEQEEKQNTKKPEQ